MQPYPFHLVQKLTLPDAARGRGLRLMFGDVLATNRSLLAFAGRLGFPAANDPRDARMRRVEIQL